MENVQVILKAAQAGNLELALRTADQELRKSPQSEVYLGLKVHVASLLNDRQLTLETAEVAVLHCNKKTIELFICPALLKFQTPELLCQAFVKVNRANPKDAEIIDLWFESMLQLGDLTSAQKALMAMQRVTKEPRKLVYQVCLVMALEKPNKVFPMLADRMLAKYLPVADPHECYVAALVYKMNSASKMVEYLLQKETSEFIAGSLELQLLLLNGLLETGDHAALFDYAQSQLVKIDSYNYWQAINTAALGLGPEKVRELQTFQTKFKGVNVELSKIDLAVQSKSDVSEALLNFWSLFKTKQSTYTYLKPYVEPKHLPELKAECLGSKINLYKFKHLLNIEISIQELQETFEQHLNEKPAEINDYFIGTDLLLLAAVILLESDKPLKSEQAGIILEHALTHDPKNFHVKLMLIHVYRSLGTYELAFRLFESLAIRPVQLEALAYLLGMRIGSTAPNATQQLMTKITHARKPASKFNLYCPHALNSGAYTQFKGIFELGRKMNRSLGFSLLQLEEIKAVRATRGSMNVSLLDLTKQPYMDLIDNRDFTTSFLMETSQLCLVGPRQSNMFAEIEIRKNLALAEQIKSPQSTAPLKNIQELVQKCNEEFTSMEKWQLSAIEQLLSGKEVNPPPKPSSELNWEVYHYLYTIKELLKIAKDIGKYQQCAKLSKLISDSTAQIDLNEYKKRVNALDSKYKFDQFAEKIVSAHQKQINQIN